MIVAAKVGAVKKIFLAAVLCLVPCAWGKPFILTPYDFPVLGEMDTALIKNVYERPSSDDASYATESGRKTLTTLIAKHKLQVLGGPMVGSVTDSSARFWMRTVKPGQVQVIVYSEENPGDKFTTQSVSTDSLSDFTAVLHIKGLKENTSYRYDVMIDGIKLEPDSSKVSSFFKGFAFKTFPRTGSNSSFTIAFGGGAEYYHQNERIWDSILTHKPKALFLLGDNVYHDLKDSRSGQRVHYYRRQLRPEFQHLTSNTPTFAIWDDHDFCGDDCGGLYETKAETWRLATLKVFKENWVNPYYGGGEETPGVWFDVSIGPVDFFFLDGRYYRNKGVTSPSMLGEVQKEWFIRKLKESKAAFKVVASPVPVAIGVKPGSKDPWDGYQKEREEIFTAIRDNNIGGVMMLSADRHRSDIWKIPQDKGYDFYEFQSSRLTNPILHDLMKDSNMLFGYNKTPSFGLVRFDFSKPEDPAVTFEIRSIDNEKIHELVLKRTVFGDYIPVNTAPALMPGGPSLQLFAAQGGRHLNFSLLGGRPDNSLSKIEIEILSTDGRVLCTENINLHSQVDKFQVSVPRLSPGVYLVRAILEKNSMIFRMPLGL